MDKSWWKSKAEQLDLFAALKFEPNVTCAHPAAESDHAEAGSQMPVLRASCSSGTVSGQPLLVPTECLSEDADNPRTEFPQSDLDELACVFQPIVDAVSG